MNRRDVLKGVVAVSVVSLAPFDADSIETTVEVKQKWADGWHHYAVSCNGREVRYFLDGEHIALDESEGLAHQHWQVFDELFGSIDLNRSQCAEIYSCGDWSAELRVVDL